MSIRSATEMLRLSLTERHWAGLVVSVLNGSPHYVRAESEVLLDRGVPRDLVDAVTRAPTWPASDDDRLDVIAIFAARLTQSPQAVGVDDIERLRSVGLTDTQIHELVNVVSYYNCLNRMTAGLGLR
jgi:uncharacterized peroxidase-related enzyme